MNTMAMLFLLMTLSDWYSPLDHEFVTVGKGFWCDHEPNDINQVISEFSQVAITSQVVWSPLNIQQAVTITGGFENCLDAKLGIQPTGFSHIQGAKMLPVITIESPIKSAVDIKLTRVVIESGDAPAGAGILANGHYRLSLEQVLIQNNHAQQQGGGLLLNGQANSLKLVNSVIKNNQARQGAGLAIDGFGHLVILENSMIQQNIAEISGGGILCNGLNLIQIQNSQINGNSAQWGQDMDAEITCQTQIGKTDFKLKPVE
ncbi:MAG: hypothetical protein KDI92_05085 [Xanthomonadales bacterium]|nr:hypothetical protein [Xanthomonadales bacterium]